MPYIKPEDRFELDVKMRYPKNAGELNYEFTKLVNAYLNDHGRKYQIMNDIMGALEGAKLEFYARMVRPYEDEKIRENGDAYYIS